MRVFSAIIVSTLSELEDFLDAIPLHSTLYLDIETARPHGHGDISLITILVHPLQEIYLVDVVALGPTRAFNTAIHRQTNNNNNYDTTKLSLHSLLQDASTPKFAWDLRRCAHTLWHRHHVNLRGALDVQLLENASRRTGIDKQFLANRGGAVRNDLFSRGGSGGVFFDEANLGVEIVNSAGSGGRRKVASSQLDSTEKILACTRGVLHLRALRDVYMRRISIAWLAHVRQESGRLVEQARKKEEKEDEEEKEKEGKVKELKVEEEKQRRNSGFYEEEDDDYDDEKKRNQEDDEEEETKPIRGPWTARLGTVAIAGPPVLLPVQTYGRPASERPAAVMAVEWEKGRNRWEHLSSPAAVPSAVPMPVQALPAPVPILEADNSKMLKKRSSFLQRWRDIRHSRPETPRRPKIREVESSAAEWWD